MFVISLDVVFVLQSLWHNGFITVTGFSEKKITPRDVLVFLFPFQDYLHFSYQSLVQSEIPWLQKNIWRCWPYHWWCANSSRGPMPHHDNWNSQVRPCSFGLIAILKKLGWLPDFIDFSFRSMLYNGSDVIRDLEWVIFDEVHYINDAEVCYMHLLCSVLMNVHQILHCHQCYSGLQQLIIVINHAQCSYKMSALYSSVTERCCVGGGSHHATETRQHHSAQRYGAQHPWICRLGRVSAELGCIIAGEKIKMKQSPFLP